MKNIKSFAFQTYYTDTHFFFLKEKMGTRLFDSVIDKLKLISGRLKIDISSNGEIRSHSVNFSNQLSKLDLFEIIKDREIVILVKDPLLRISSGIFESYIHGGIKYQIYFSIMNNYDRFTITDIIQKYEGNKILTNEETNIFKKYIKSILSFCLIEYAPLSDNHIEQYHYPLYLSLKHYNINNFKVYDVNEFFSNEIANNKFLFDFNFKKKEWSWGTKKNIVIECIREYISESKLFEQEYNRYMIDERKSYEYFLNKNG